MVLNASTSPVIIELRGAGDHRAWEIPSSPGGGPGIYTDAGTPATFYTADCHALMDVVIGSNGQGFAVMPDGSIDNVDVGGVRINSTLHSSCE